MIDQVISAYLVIFIVFPRGTMVETRSFSDVVQLCAITHYLGAESLLTAR